MAADPFAEARALAEAEGRPFDPEDPWNWKGIAAALEAQQAAATLDTPAPATRGATPYVNPEDDPQYMAWLAQYEYNKAQAEQDSGLRSTRAQSDYEAALAELERQGLTGARDLDVNLLSRGVYGSGEAGRRRGDLSKSLALGREQVDTALANETGDIEADKLRALTQLDLEREQQIVASRARIAAAQQVVPGGGGSVGGGGGGGGGAAAAPGVQTYNPITAPVIPLPVAPGVARQPYQTGSGLTVDAGVRNVMEDRHNTAKAMPKPKPVVKPATKPTLKPVGGRYLY